jgi:predicted 3-demethylubiquinone-9 3-methyltransferase (glyoxalase superfamily)
MQKVTPFLGFDGNLEEAVDFYAAVFPNAAHLCAKLVSQVA